MTEVVIIGTGMAGSATAWALARRGRSVTVLERFAAGHDRGSSHGTERIFRLGYTDPAYVALAREALPGWHALEKACGQTLLHPTGAIDHGDPVVLDAVATACRDAGVAVEELNAAAASSRWPGMRFEGTVVFQPDGGRLDADIALRAFWSQASGAGAELRFETPVLGVRDDGDGVVVDTPSGAERFGAAVVTAAGWSGSLLEGTVAATLVPPITVTAETVAYFRPRVGPWPSFIHRAEPLAYGLGAPDGLVKAAHHGTGPVIAPDDRPAAPSAEALGAVQAYVAEWLPGLEPEVVGASICLYASTASDDFVLDARGRLVVGVGFGGHGFKFAPAVGERLADLAEEVLAGDAPSAARPFAAARLSASGAGAPTTWR